MSHGTGGLVLEAGAAVAILVAAPAGRPARDAAATAALRAATGRSDIVVGRRPTGRPRLEPPHPELAVSLSVRGGLMLVGFVPTGRVGVDLEPIDAAAVPDPARLARDHFASGESLAVARAIGDAAVVLFLRLWVAKEAALKLTGRGVYDGMREPDLSGALAALGRDRVAFDVALPGAGAVRIAVAAVTTGAGPHLCALAVAAGGPAAAP